MTLNAGRVQGADHVLFLDLGGSDICLFTI